MAEDVEVAEEATNTDYRVVTTTHHQTSKASAVTAALHILRGNVLHMNKPATTVVWLVTTVDTVTWSKDHQLLAGDHVERCMRLNLMTNTNTTLSRSSSKWNSTQAVTKEHNSHKNNVIFDEIADVPKHNLRILSDLYTQSLSRKDLIRFKLDMGAGGNMLPYDTWKEFFLGQSSASLAKIIDRGVTLQAYSKCEIRQLGTCNLKISNNGTICTCHFFIVPSQYCPILGLNDMMALNLVTFNCLTTTSWSLSRTSTSIDTVTYDSVNQTIDLKKPLTLTDVIDNPKYKHLFHLFW